MVVQSAAPPLAAFGVETPSTWFGFVVLTQFGVTRRFTRSGMAASRYACLSPIDAELSIENRMSSLSTACSATSVVKLVFVVGSPGTTGRSRHPTAETPTVQAKTRPAMAQPTACECIAFSEGRGVPSRRMAARDGKPSSKNRL